MSLPSTVKRRRLDKDADRLKKPFVSPLKTAGSPRVSSVKRLDNGPSTPYQPSTLSHTIKTSVETEVPVEHVKSALSTKSTPVRKSQLRPSSSLRRKGNPEENAVQKELTRLEMQVRALQNDIDALKQSSALRASTTDVDLEDLSQKWKLASQTAAEELFGTVKERVYRMGGVAAWRESEKRKYERSTGGGEFAEEPDQGGDADCEFDSQGEELPLEEQSWRKQQKKKAREEARDAAEVLSSEPDELPGRSKVWQESDADDDIFTMAMMLRSLNIELHVIGYDRQGQRWIS